MPFLPPSAAGEMLPGGSRGDARCGVQGRAPPGARGKRGQDTKVSCPLLRLPNFPLAATPFGHAAKTRGTLGCAFRPRFSSDV